MATVRIRWPDGKEYGGNSWSDLLRRINALPWNEHMDESEFRQELARRAYVWSETIVNPAAPPATLFRELAKAGALEILSDGRVRA